MDEASQLPGFEEILTVVSGLAEAFGARGHRLYLVGGVVRDLLLGQGSADEDIDLTTDAGPDVIKEVVRPVATAWWTQGERFGTIGATVNGHDLEVTTHRAEAYDPGSRKPVVAFGDSLAEDLSRRDFTINAMAISIPDGVLVDPYRGREDLAGRRLATPRSPAQSFTDDPLRMLRAARFLPRFDLTCEPGLEEAATELAHRLAIVSVERVHDELERLLVLERPAPGLEFLVRTGLLIQAVPAFAEAGESMGRGVGLAASAPTPLSRRAGLLLPLGSTAATGALTRLRYSRALQTETVALIDALSLVESEPPGAPALRRVVARVGTGALAELRALAALAGRDTRLFELYDELSLVEDLDDLSSPLSGRQIMEHLGIDPGPLVGEASDFLTDQRIERGPLAEAEAIALLDRWWSEADPSIG